MFQSSRKPQGGLSSAFSIAELIYHSIVRSVRRQHNNAFVAIAINVMQTAGEHMGRTLDTDGLANMLLTRPHHSRFQDYRRGVGR